jgi:multiple sugar transport system ATP-binding protein
MTAMSSSSARPRKSTTRPSNLFVATFMGSPAMNVLPARMRADADVHPGQSFDFAVNMDKAVLFDPETEKRIG